MLLKIHHMKKTILKLSITFLLILPQLFWSHTNAEISPPTKPNIIFIMADDLGKALLSVYGARPVIKMPNLERLAKEGVVFKNSYATPVCFSTRVQLVSGRYALNTGAYANQFPGGDSNIRTRKYLNRVVAGERGRTSGFYKYFYKDDPAIHPFVDPQYTPSFAIPLKHAGYTTAVVGKWHLNNYEKQQRIFRTYGFDQWMMYHSHTSTRAVTDKGLFTTPAHSPYMPAVATDFIIDFITENKNKPFFIYYPMQLVHAPYIAPSDIMDGLRESKYSSIQQRIYAGLEKLNLKESRYIAMIEYVDLIIGRIVAALEAFNLRDRTIIFFSGDNGSAKEYVDLYEQVTKDVKNKPFHGKGSLYEGGVNVPLIVSGGPVKQRGKTEALTDFTDILPTLADFAGVPVVRESKENDADYRGIAELYTSVAGLYKVDGVSIAPYLTGQAEDTPRKWIMYSNSKTTVIRDKRFKLWAGRENKLYDLYNDPYEQFNIYDSVNANTVIAKQRLENIVGSLPAPSLINMYFDPVDWNYGMLAHWTMDQSELPEKTTVLADTEGGYDAQSNTDVVAQKSGKLGEAVAANLLFVPQSKGLFYNFIIGDSSDKLYSRKGDREKFLSSMTVAAWVQTQQPNRTTYLLRQPYTNKEGNLIAFSISEDGTISFELVTNGKHQKLESSTLDKQLWGQWIHIAATWDGRDECGKAVLYVNGESIAQSCLGRPLSAENTNDLLLGETQDSTVDNANTLIDDVAIWRQPLMPMQIDAVYKLGDRFSYNASEVDALFNTPEKDGITQIGEHQWQRTTLEQTPNAAQLTIRVLPNATEIQFGDVMAIRCLSCIPS